MTDQEQAEKGHTEEDLYLFSVQAMQSIMELLKGKGEQYTNGDALTNFRTNAGFLGLSPKMYLMVLATKHWHALLLNAQGKAKSQKELGERAKDVIVYMLIYLFMLDLGEQP
jgi:hypothetical protein